MDEITSLFHAKWLVASMIIFLSALLQALTGFGFALIAIPFLTIFFDPHWAIPLVSCISFFTLSWSVRTVWKDTDKPLLKRLLVSSFVGLPIGGWIIGLFDHRSFTVVVSLVILFSTFLLFIGPFIQKVMEKWTKHDWIFGAFSGLLTSSVGLPGPPIMLVLSAKIHQRDQFRATGISFLFFIYPFSLSIFALNGRISMDIAPFLLVMLPIAIMGVKVGNCIHNKISPLYFKYLIYVLLFCTGLYSLIKNL